MEIALITKNFAPIRGGAERYGYNLAQEMAQMGHNIHVFCNHFEVPIHPAIRHHPVKKWRKPFKAKSYIDNIRQVLVRNDFSVVYSIVPYYPADVYRAGDGVHLHWTHLNHPNPLKRAICQFLPGKWSTLAIERQIYDPSGNYKFFITNSNLVKGHIQRYYQIAPERIHVIYNGVDHETFHPGEKSHRNGWLQSKGIPSSSLVILFVGNNWERKGLKTLLRGARKWLLAQKAVLVVIGRGKPKKWTHLLNRLGISSQVYFVGQTQDVTSWYRASDVLALPTLYDPFANVTLEAMASGVPAITTAENGASEIIRNGENGYVLARSDDAQSLQEFLGSLMEGSLRANMAQKALETAQGFTLRKNAQETLSVLEKAAISRIS